MKLKEKTILLFAALLFLLIAPIFGLLRRSIDSYYALLFLVSKQFLKDEQKVCSVF